MIEITEVETYGWKAALRGMRNALDSHDKADSILCIDMPKCGGCVYDEGCGFNGYEGFMIGPNDMKLASKLANAGTDHGKFLRFIHAQFDLRAPLYFWKQFDTYRIGVEKNSESTMHCIHREPFDRSDFSYDYLSGGLDVSDPLREGAISPYDLLDEIIYALNVLRDKYLETGDKKYWYQMIQLLPDSYMQKRTVDASYAALRNMYNRKTHKLDEWRTFCSWEETLPYAKELICNV